MSFWEAPVFFLTDNLLLLLAVGCGKGQRLEGQRVSSVGLTVMYGYQGQALEQGELILASRGDSGFPS